MTTWTANQLARIEAADQLAVQPARADGTLRAPVPIWVVRDGEDLYIRSYRGQEGAWYRAASAQRRGRIASGGVEADVTFAAVPDADVNDRVDAAYRAKYRRFGGAYVDPMVAPVARDTTLRILPR